MSNKKGTKRTIIDPGQEQNLGQRESGRDRRSDTTSPVLTRQDRPNSSGLRPVATRSNGIEASATRATGGIDRTGAIATTTGGTNGTGAIASRATGGTNGTGAIVEATGRTNGTGAIASGATNETIHSPAAGGAALGRAVNGSMSSTGVDPEVNDQTRTPEEGSVSEMATAGSTTPTQSRFINRGGSDATSSSTVDRTKTRATTSPEASAGSLGRVRSADDISVRAATGVTTLPQSNSRGRSQAGTEDRAVPRPDPASDPRREAALRAVKGRTPIIREDPGAGAIATTTCGTNETGAIASATGGTDGTGAIVRATGVTN